MCGTLEGKSKKRGALVGIHTWKREQDMLLSPLRTSGHPPTQYGWLSRKSRFQHAATLEHRFSGSQIPLLAVMSINICR